MKVMSLNIRSLLPKIEEFRKIVLDNDYDIVTVTETWLSQNIPNEHVLINGYKLFRNDRSGRGGGVAIYVKSCLDKVVLVDCISYISFEQLWVSFILKNKYYCVGVIYRPPNSHINDFLTNFDDTLSILAPKFNYLMCTGDININLLHFNRVTESFGNILAGYDLNQCILEPTRFVNTSQTLLDIIACSSDMQVSQIKITSLNHPYDHCFI